jgi:DUF1680 family protein
VNVLVNDRVETQGDSGTYASIVRTWKNGDIVSFALSLNPRLVLYTGTDQDTYPRYALVYGPVLMALVGQTSEAEIPSLPFGPEELLSHLQRDDLTFSIDGCQQYRFVPYYAVDDEPFSCFPTLSKARF